MSKFIRYGDKTLPMPEGMTLEQAKEIMARHFPELAANPKVETVKSGDDTTYVFSKQAGTKGRGKRKVKNAKLIARLNRVSATPIVPQDIQDFVMGKVRLFVSAHMNGTMSEEVEKVERVHTALLGVEPVQDNGSILL